jgi:hypothetical protein
MQSWVPYWLVGMGSLSLLIAIQQGSTDGLGWMLPSAGITIGVCVLVARALKAKS